MKKLLLIFSLLIGAIGIQAQSFVGSWHGKADLGAATLRISFHIDSTETGYSAKMDSPDQSAFGIPADTAFVDNNQITIEIDQIGLVFKGERTAEDEMIIGTINQMGRKFPVELSPKPVEKEEKIRPQEPKPPFDYEVREITFENAKAQINLAGTLTIPQGKGPFPAVVLISGSGPQDRNEEILGHKPFLVIADHFAQNGIAVLRYDDRGIAESEGDFEGATSREFADDALAAVEFLKKTKKIDPKAIGLAGHSEGGLVAAIAAAKSEKVNFVISLAGTGVSGGQVLRTQITAIALAEGTPESAVEASLQEQEQIISAIEKAEDYEDARERVRTALDSIIAQSDQEIPDVESLKNQTLSQYGTPWMHYFINYDPAQSWRQIEDIPVLAINGTNDLQVEAETNLNAIEDALEEAGNEDITTMKIHGLNHLFQRSATGRVSEYGKIEETINESVLELMTNWIHERF
ncbi:alpha/beta hydrolase [Halocola ammonii]